MRTPTYLVHPYVTSGKFLGPVGRWGARRSFRRVLYSIPGDRPNFVPGLGVTDPMTIRLSLVPTIPPPRSMI